MYTFIIKQSVFKRPADFTRNVENDHLFKGTQRDRRIITEPLHLLVNLSNKLSAPSACHVARSGAVISRGCLLPGQSVLSFLTTRVRGTLTLVDVELSALMFFSEGCTRPHLLERGARRRPPETRRGKTRKMAEAEKREAEHKEQTQKTRQYCTCSLSLIHI